MRIAARKLRLAPVDRCESKRTRRTGSVRARSINSRFVVVDDAASWWILFHSSNVFGETSFFDDKKKSSFAKADETKSVHSFYIGLGRVKITVPRSENSSTRASLPLWHTCHHCAPDNECLELFSSLFSKENGKPEVYIYSDSSKYFDTYRRKLVLYGRSWNLISTVTKHDCSDRIRKIWN